MNPAFLILICATYFVRNNRAVLSAKVADISSCMGPTTRQTSEAIVKYRAFHADFIRYESGDVYSYLRYFVKENRALWSANVADT